MFSEFQGAKVRKNERRTKENSVFIFPEVSVAVIKNNRDT